MKSRQFLMVSRVQKCVEFFQLLPLRYDGLHWVLCYAGPYRDLSLQESDQ